MSPYYGLKPKWIRSVFVISLINKKKERGDSHLFIYESVNKDKDQNTIFNGSTPARTLPPSTSLPYTYPLVGLLTSEKYISV